MQEKFVKIVIIYMCVVAGLFTAGYICRERNVYGADDSGNIVVVIDPGHGGTNGGADDGAINDDIVERYINMSVANAMYQELSKYDGVKVYLTHDSAEENMSLKARSEFAESVNADFLFSLHFNASEEHDKYGMEVWIPSIGNYYVAGYQFADIELNELADLGIFRRGIKTRVGDNDDEYYGIIRECEWRNINAVIIEHCYMDSITDKGYVDNEKDLEEFGIRDATAAAKYFGLKSSKTGTDYSEFAKLEVEAPNQRVYQDSTPPEVCSISLNKVGNGSVNFKIAASDSDTYINYYSYSLDGGTTFSELMQWNDLDGDDIINVTIANVNVDIGNLVVKVYNKHDVTSESNVLELKGIQDKTEQNDTKNRIRNRIGRYNKELVAIIHIAGGIVATILIIKRKNKTIHGG